VHELRLVRGGWGIPFCLYSLYLCTAVEHAIDSAPMECPHLCNTLLLRPRDLLFVQLLSAEPMEIQFGSGRPAAVGAAFGLMPQGVMTEGRIPKEATVKLEVRMGSAVGGQAQPQSRVFSSVAEAREAAPGLAGGVAKAATDAYVSAVRLQSLMGEVGLRSKANFSQNGRVPWGCGLDTTCVSFSATGGRTGRQTDSRVNGWTQRQLQRLVHGSLSWGGAPCRARCSTWMQSS
jgi:hypothetical protein